MYCCPGAKTLSSLMERTHSYFVSLSQLGERRAWKNVLISLSFSILGCSVFLLSWDLPGSFDCTEGLQKLKNWNNIFKINYISRQWLVCYWQIYPYASEPSSNLKKRHTRKNCLVHSGDQLISIDSSILKRWDQVGIFENLVSHSQIAAFLVQL